METLIVKPANEKEAELLKSMIKKMRVKYTILDEEEKEDFALAKAMLAAKKSKIVSESTIMKKLKA